VEAVLGEHGRRYRAVVADGSTVGDGARAAVRAAAARVPVGVVSGAERQHVELIMAAAGLDGLLGATVGLEDVRRGKPDPEGYLLGLARLDARLAAADVLVFEDTDHGVAAARAAGMRCVAVLGSVPAARLQAADEVVPALDAALVTRLLDAR
jgi:beta-phosphoglucomutase-like phosphatase (HAD superfamily)